MGFFRTVRDVYSHMFQASAEDTATGEVLSQIDMNMMKLRKLNVIPKEIKAIRYKEMLAILKLDYNDIDEAVQRLIESGKAELNHG